MSIAIVGLVGVVAALGATPASAESSFDPLGLVNAKGLLGVAPPASPGNDQPALGTQDVAAELFRHVEPITITPVSSGQASAAPDGTVVVIDSSGDFGFVTGINNTGTNASYVVLSGADAPTSHSFTISHGNEVIELVLNADGTVTVTDGAGNFVNYFSAPWAIDASGNALATWYEVDGDVITQHINTSNARFPVIADPSAECGIGWCSVYFNRSETHDIATAGLAALGGAVAACAAGGPLVVAVCTIGAAAIGATAIYADNHNQCVGVVAYGIAPPAAGWNPFVHSDVHCYT